MKGMNLLRYVSIRDKRADLTDGLAWASTPSVFSVLDDGVRADATTNDRTAINNTAARAEAAGGGVVFFPPGVFRITNDLALRDNVHFVGSGVGITTIRVDGNFNAFQGNGDEHFSIRDLTIDCTSQTGGSGMELKLCTDFWVDQVEVLNAFGNGISVGGSGTATPNQLRGFITRCLISTPGNHGISLANGTWWVTIAGNQVFNATESHYNISSSHHCAITGNIGHNDATATGGFGGVRLSNDSEYCSVSGNTMTGASRGFFVASTAGSGNAITGNTALNCYDEGILVEVDHVTVAGNTVTDAWESGSGGAIVLSIAQYCTALGNTIYDTRTPKQHTYGVREQSGADNNKLGPNAIDGFLTAAYDVIGAGSVLFD